MFFKIAFSRPVVIGAINVSLIVGSVLALVNHGTAIINLTLSLEIVIKIFLSYLVPYCVSTYSTVKAIQNKD